MGREKSREIIENSRNRAILLMDYLTRHTEIPLEQRKIVFFTWFKKERYSWYSILVLEECFRIAEQENTPLTEEQYIGIAAYLLGLYKEHGRTERYQELCRKIVTKYEGKTSSLGSGQKLWLNYIARIVGIPEIPEISEVVKETSSKMPNQERAFEEITARFMESKPLAVNEECAKFFVGRDAWIEDYSKRLRSGIEGILVFYGQYRVGKSSVLEHLKYYLKEDFEIIAVSMGDMMDPGHFYTAIVQQIREGEERKKKYKDLVRSFMARRDENGALKVTDLEEFIDVVDERLEEEGSGKKLLFFLDEFSGLVNKESFANDDQFLSILRKKVNEQKIQVVITGSEVMQQCMQKWTNFFGKCSLEKLEYLEEEPTYQLLEESIRMSDGTSRWDSNRELLHRVYNLTKGHPSITQVIGNMIVKRLNAEKQNMITVEIIDEIENEILTVKYSDWLARFHPILDCGTERWKRDDVIQICAKVEDAYRNKISQRELLNRFENPEDNELYMMLLDRGIITKSKENDVPQVYMELFGKWCHSWYEIK